MKITYSNYVELPAPLAVIRDALADPTTWTALPTGATRLGTFWRWDTELYTAEFLPAVPGPQTAADLHTLRWSFAPVAIGPRVTVTVTLHDATISTHATIQVDLDHPGLRWPWQRQRVLRSLAAVVRACSVALQEIVCEQVITPPSLEVLTLETPVAVGVSSDARSTTLATSTAFSRSPSARSPHDTLAEQLRARFPQTVAHFEAMNALDHLERVWRLEHGWERIMRGEYDAGCHVVDTQPIAAAEYDLIYAGGGLGLLHAVVMAKRYGRRVLVFDRSEVGCVHREWNISRPELQALVDLGVVTWAELSAVIMREYRDGLVRFHSGPQSAAPPTDLWLPEVLNVALDAGALLRLMRRKLEAAGGAILSHRAFRRVRVTASNPLRVAVELEPLPGAWVAGQAKTVETYTAQLLLDGMGSTSPLALHRHAGRPFAGVCPTVGTVAEGFAQGSGPQEYDPTLGDILISVADVQQGQQLMWEGFPGRDDEMTVYLFYYSTLQQQAHAAHGDALLSAKNGGATGSGSTSYSLLDLFEQYFTLLPTYKQPGPHFRHVKPVYGYIPARHSLRPQEAPLLRGVLPVGDSAAQQSPLTFCGFGSHVRNLHRTTSLLNYALNHNLLTPDHLHHISAFQSNVSLNWVFSRFMQPWDAPHNVNELQNIFLEVLVDLGVPLATRFFQDRMRWSDYHPMILGVLRRYRMILPISFRVLGVSGMWQWFCDYLRFTAMAAGAALGRCGGRWGEAAAYWLADRCSVALGLRTRARYAEWRTMGWV